MIVKFRMGAMFLIIIFPVATAVVCIHVRYIILDEYMYLFLKFIILTTLPEPGRPPKGPLLPLLCTIRVLIKK